MARSEDPERGLPDLEKLEKPNFIPNSLTTFFLILQLVFGQDNGFTKVFQKKHHKFIKVYTVVLSILFLFGLVSFVYFREIWMWLIFFKSASYFFISKLNKYRLYDFLNEIHSFKDDISAIDRNQFGLLLSGYSMVMFLSKGLLVTIRCVFGRLTHCNIISYTYHVFYSAACLSTDTISDPNVVIFYYVYSYSRFLKNSLEEEFDLNLFERKYVGLVKSWSKIKPVSDKIIIMELCFNTPRLMVTLWGMLVYIKQNAGWYSYITELLFVLHLTIQMCIPAVITEMANCQMDAIKIMLNERLRLEKDQEKLLEVSRVLRYVKARRLQSDIWRVIPVDLRLPLALLSLCTTYFIVILQFTHLYD